MAPKKPIIAISLDQTENNAKYCYSAKPWYALRTCYADAVSQHGGIPIMLPFDHNVIDELLDIADGVIIPGGDFDMPPEWYGQEILTSNVVVNERRSNYDRLLLEKTLERNKPYLGICYGMQLLNVMLGGSLIQDLRTFCPSDINHEQPEPKDAPSHKISLIAESKLASFSGAEMELYVNSTHHQAIDRVGEGLKVTARADDGIIEAIEAEDYDFVIGVEWHPEYINTNLDRKIFQEFIAASARGRLN